MTNLDPNLPPVGPRSRAVADRPQTMWMIAAAIAILLVVGYFVSGDRTTSVVPLAPETTMAPADTSATPPATDTGTVAPTPAPDATAPATGTTAPADPTTTPPAAGQTTTPTAP
ncbi:MAG: hypothetical protein WAT77_07040 [Paracoccaceae bacterium]